MQSEGHASARMRWQTPEGKWHAQSLDHFPSTVKSGGEWELVAGASVVPDGAGKLVLLLSADGQQSDKDVIWWDDVTVFRVD